MKRKKTKRSKKPRTPAGSAALKTILNLREKMDAGEITPHQFAQLLQREAFRTEWSARVQLRAIARDLLPKAAALARRGRPRLLGLLTKIFLTTETADIRKMAALYASPRTIVLTHHIPRPDRDAPEQKPSRKKPAADTRSSAKTP